MKNQYSRSFGRSLALLFLVLVTAGIHPVFAESPDISTSVDQQAPAWATSANWYQLSVPLFRNGSKENDPPGTKPWTATCDPKNVGKQEDGVHAGPPPLYGGDLQGLSKRLNYLQRLGINALILTDVFSGMVATGGPPVDVRHIDDSLGIKNSLGELDQTAKQTGDALTKTDKLFVAFLKEAHGAGFRVVVSAPWPPTDKTGVANVTERESNAMAATRRWMDPNKDSNPSDGVDGWVLHDRGVADESTLARWYKAIKKINADTVVISADGDKFGETVCDLFIDYPGLRSFDSWVRLVGGVGPLIGSALVAVDTRPKLAAEGSQSCRTKRLTPVSMNPRPSHTPGGSVLADDKYCEKVPLLPLLPKGNFGVPWIGPSQMEDSARSTYFDDDERSFWMLTTVHQHLAGSAPLTYFGDEVGMQKVRQCAGMPMWWNDLASAALQPNEYRVEFYALTKLMNQLRSRFPALRSGEIHRKAISPSGPWFSSMSPDVLVFSRSLPDEEIIVALNLGKERRTGPIPVGYPGQLVGVLSPQIRPGRVSPFAGSPQTIGGKPVPQLGIGAQRRHADEWGDITLKLKPESVRLIVIGDVRR